MGTAIARAWLGAALIVAAELLAMMIVAVLALYWMFSGAASLIRSVMQL